MKNFGEINLIKEKHSRAFKGRSVANGREQRTFQSCKDITSPTVTNDSLTVTLMMTLMIDGIEGREVATADVPGVYLQVPMSDFVEDEQSISGYHAQHEYKIQKLCHN